MLSFIPKGFPVVKEFRAKNIDDDWAHISIWSVLSDKGTVYEGRYVNLDSYDRGEMGLPFKLETGEVARFSTLSIAEKEIRNCLANGSFPVGDVK